ncbi:hypothetical protein V8F20_007573 [Naviculisporaceae sp. PSN 640]
MAPLLYTITTLDTITGPAWYCNRGEVSIADMRFGLLSSAVVAATLVVNVTTLAVDNTSDDVLLLPRAGAEKVPTTTTDLIAVPQESKRMTTTTGTKGTTTDIELASRQLEYFLLTIISFAKTAQAIWNAWGWAIGLFGLGASAYSVDKDCRRQYDRTDCIIASVGLVISGFQTIFKVASGRVRSDGLPSYGTWTDPDEPRRTAEVHVPLTERGRIPTEHIQARDLAASKNGTWERHITFYWDGKESQYLMYRAAHPDDLGHENDDGSFHHYRAQDSDRVIALEKEHGFHGLLAKREENRAYGVVTDYLWKNEQKSMWQDLHDSADFNDMKRKTSGYLQNNNQIASCLSVLGLLGTHGGSATSRLNNGVIAYGWNNKPFGFNGRAGDWTERCKGRNT